MATFNVMKYLETQQTMCLYFLLFVNTEMVQVISRATNDVP